MGAWALNDDIIGGSTEDWLNGAPEVLAGFYQVHLRTLDRFVGRRVSDPFFSPEPPGSPAS